MKTDIEIARESKILKISEIAKKIGATEEDLEFYGKYKAKLSKEFLQKIENNSMGKLILVTAINPTPAGEGKTTTTIALGQALSSIGEKTIIALREPSLGPCFGMKGGATGGGNSQVIPMEDINLHFTGDLHAITVSHNLLSSLIDNHIHFGNSLNIDINNIKWKRALDLNDRSLRNIVIGLNNNGSPREENFIITVSSEIMAILCLSQNLYDFKEKVGNILIAFTKTGKAIYAKDLNAHNAIAVLMKDAIKPNLVQTLEGTPVLIHGGPFANIAHGCSSIIATKTALKLADYVITEAGFGADLGAEKFLDIKCRKANLTPSAIVLVATVRALKYNGGIAKENLKIPNLEAVENGIVNLGRHIENLQKYKIPIIITINKFTTDSQAEINFIQKFCNNLNIPCEVCEGWEFGGKGSIELAKTLLKTINNEKNNFKFLYDENLSIIEKINIIAKEIYRAKDVIFSDLAKKNIKEIEKLNLNKLPICIAKTQYSFSDNKKLLGAPNNFSFHINEIKISNGAGFIVCIAGDIMTMPGLPKTPSAEIIDIDENENVVGLF